MTRLILRTRFAIGDSELETRDVTVETTREISAETDPMILMDLAATRLIEEIDSVVVHEAELLGDPEPAA